MTILGGRLRKTAGLAGLLLCAAASAQQGAQPGRVSTSAPPSQETAPAAPPSATLPGRDRPLPEAAPIPDLDFTIQAPRRSAVPRAVEELTFDVKDVKIVGATQYANDALRSYVQPMIGQTVHLNDLITVAEAIEARYHQDGYVLTRVFVPTQSVNDGVFQITVVEGYVAAVAVQGSDESSRSRIERLLAPVTASRPLKLATLETALLVANKLPGLSATGLLRPSATEAGASELVVTVADQPISGGVTADNLGAASSGRWTIAADASSPSHLGDGGVISLNASVDPASVQERRSVGGKYTAPLPLLDGLTYSLTGLGSHGEPGGTVASLNLITDSTAFGLRAGLPLMAGRADELSIDGGLTVQSADVHALGAPLTHDEWRVADVALTYLNNAWAAGITSATIDVAEGIPSLGASKSGSAGLSRAGARTDFTKFTGLLRRTQAIQGPFSAAVTLSGQYSPDTLLIGEEVSFGGGAIGRGYDPGSITGDRGVGGSFELRYDTTLDWIYINQAQFFGFWDRAATWNRVGENSYNQLSSAGGGVKFSLPENVTLGLIYGHALISTPGNESGKRTQRVLATLSARF